MSGEQLERRYRGLLRTLPKPYREAREEELLSVLMDGASEGRRWPDAREVLSLAWLGLRVRVRGAGAGNEGGALQSTRFGEMARLVGIIGSALLAFVGVTQLARFMRNMKGFPGYKPWQILNPVGDHSHGPLAVIHYSIANFEVPVCWLLVLALISVGWWRAARVLAALVFLFSAYLTTDVWAVTLEEPTLAAVTAAALFAARGPHARPVRIPGLVTVAALIGAMGYTYRTYSGYLASHQPVVRVLEALQGWGQTDAGYLMVAVTVAVAVVCVVAYRSVVWPVVLAVVSVAALGPATVLDLTLPQTARPDMVPLVCLPCGLVVVAALAVLKERRSQRSAARGGEVPAG